MPELIYEHRNCFAFLRARVCAYVCVCVQLRIAYDDEPSAAAPLLHCMPDAPNKLIKSIQICDGQPGAFRGGNVAVDYGQPGPRLHNRGRRCGCVHVCVRACALLGRRGSASGRVALSIVYCIRLGPSSSVRCKSAINRVWNRSRRIFSKTQ